MGDTNSKAPASSGDVSSNKADNREGLLKRLLNRGNKGNDQNPSASGKPSPTQPAQQAMPKMQSVPRDVSKVASTSSATGNPRDRPVTAEKRSVATSVQITTGQNAKSDARVPSKPPEKQKIHGIDADLYRKITEQIGRPVHQKRSINTDLAYKMHEAGWSYKQIGKYFNVSGCTVRRRLREAGLR